MEEFLNNIFNVTVLVQWLIEFIIVYKVLRQTGKKEDKNSLNVVYALALAGIVLANIALKYPFMKLPGSRSAQLMIAICLVMAGVLMRFWSFKALGKFFSRIVMVQKNQKVVKNGPYKFIRHPSYLAGIIIFLGYGVFLGSWISLTLVVLFLLIGYLYRMGVEEKFLSRTLGKEYINYMDKTKRLIPFIY